LKTLGVDVEYFLATLRRKNGDFERIINSKEMERGTGLAIISPPDSPDDASDDEEIEVSTERQLQNLEELQGSVKAIAEQQKPPRIREGEGSTKHNFWPSDFDSDEDEGKRQYRVDSQTIRKKSGETVKPVLRRSHRKRASSMPGTPTFTKAVHYDTHLEHVRQFLSTDRPLAVGAGAFPTETTEMPGEQPLAKRSEK
jgi:hypothetical protein